MSIADEDDDSIEADIQLYMISTQLILRHLSRMTRASAQRRKPNWQHSRIDWKAHVDQLLHESLFQRTYRMSLKAFEKLTFLLGDRLIMDPSVCPVDEPIYPEIVVAVGIRYLSGGSCLDLKTAYGISFTSAYRCRTIFIEAVNSCPELDINMPSTVDEMKKVADDFATVSTDSLIRGCVGCIDGFLATTKRPTMKESNNSPRAFYSGHYNTFGLNIQAVCDVRCRFLFFGVVAPGKCGDQVAFERTALFEYTKGLPDGYYIIGDAAYSVGEKVLTPFTGGHRGDPAKDAYNFFLSQLRIRIEMSFGLLTNKWRILQAPLQTSLETSSAVLVACACLHNYCLKEDGGPVDDKTTASLTTALHSIDPDPRSDFGWGYTPTVEKYQSIPGTSIMRDMLLRVVTRYGMRRPPANIERRRYELHEVGLM